MWLLRLAANLTLVMMEDKVCLNFFFSQRISAPWPEGQAHIFQCCKAPGAL